jgi:hypothetical protein
MIRNILMVFAIFFILTNTSFSDSIASFPDTIRFGEREPCTPWYPAIDWEGPKKIRLDYDGCTWIIEYYQRITELGIRGELQITGMFLVGGANCNTSKAELKQAALVKLWNDNPMGWSWDIYEYVVSNRACSEYLQSGNGPENSLDFIIPGDFVEPSELIGLTYTVLPNNLILFPGIDCHLSCTDSACCWCYYNITRNPLTTQVISVEYYPPTGGIIQPLCEEPNKCAPDCNSLAFNWYAPPEQYTYVNSNNTNNISLNIIPSISTGQIQIEFSSQSNTNLMINILDNLGIAVYQNTFNKSQNNFKCNLDVSEYSSGVYYCIIKQDDAIIVSKKFIISK